MYSIPFVCSNACHSQIYNTVSVIPVKHIVGKDDNIVIW